MMNAHSQLRSLTMAMKCDERTVSAYDRSLVTAMKQDERTSATYELSDGHEARRTHFGRSLVINK